MESNKYWQECEEIGTFVHCWWESKHAASVENDAKIEFKKLKSSYNLATPLVCISPKELKAGTQKAIVSPCSSQHYSQ